MNQTNISHQPDTHPSILWNGPTENQWGWLLSNLNIGRGVNGSCDAVQAIASSPSSNNATAPFDTLAQRVSNSSLKSLTAVDGRFDPALIEFFHWESQWNQLVANSSATPAKPKKSRRKSVSGEIVRADVISSDNLNEKPITSVSGSFSDKFGLVLGENWPGHRRTFPLPDWCIPFYWYELFDRIIPWVHDFLTPSAIVGNGIDSKLQRGEKISTTSSPPRPNPRVEKLLSTSSEVFGDQSGNLLIGLRALVVTDTLTATSMWDDLLTAQQANTVIVHSQAMNARLRPNLVVIDVSPTPRRRLTSMDDRSPIDQNLVTIITNSRKRYPDALLVTVDSFPTWKSWEFYLANGSDIMIPRPFHWYGLLWCLQYWLFGPRQVRISVD